MGIDLLDVSFRLQRALPVEFHQRDWESLFAKREDITAGRLFELVLAKLGPAVCDAESRAVIDRVRAALGRLAGVPVNEIGLGSAVIELLPRERLPTDWAALEHLLGWKLPKLRGFSRNAMFLPAGCETVGGLIDASAMLNLGRLAHATGPYAESVVWAVVRSVLVEALGVEPSEVRRDAHLIDDLGMH